MSVKQGIVTILGSDSERNKAPSIRRTLSADMSSKKWLQQNGFNLFPVKKINNVSSGTLDSDEECDKHPRQEDVWRSIQAKKEKNGFQEPVWSSILTQKSDNSLLPPPYVPPMVKRSSSTLSEKSLEICTESLGSETGSDCFSSEILSDGDEDKEDRERVGQEELNENEPFVDLDVPKYRKSPARPFPPPLASIAGGDGAAFRMHSRRENGRLVLEAVSVPPRNNFHAQRGHGRLVLTLIRSPITAEESRVEELEKVFDNMEEVDEDTPAEDHGGEDGGYEEEEEAEDGVVVEEKFDGIEQNSRSLPSGMISMHKSRILMKKLVAMGNQNPTWSKKVEEFDNASAADVVEELPIPQSLPPPPRVGRLIPPPSPLAAASFNAYDYFWRNKSTVPTASCGLVNATTVKNSNSNNDKITKAYEHQDLVLVKGNKAEYFVPYMRRCKEGRRSLIIWEPDCIATS